MERSRLLPTIRRRRYLREETVRGRHLDPGQLGRNRQSLLTNDAIVDEQIASR
jgi:hypothetical protein